MGALCNDPGKPPKACVTQVCSGAIVLPGTVPVCLTLQGRGRSTNIPARKCMILSMATVCSCEAHVPPTSHATSPKPESNVQGVPKPEHSLPPSGSQPPSSAPLNASIISSPRETGPASRMPGRWPWVHPGLGQALADGLLQQEVWLAPHS